jgi:hypothetical protein
VESISVVCIPVESVEINYRNFNLCRHCVGQGEEGLLSRLSESMPMISRSDGKFYHLLLADRPAPYPAERKFKRTQKLSLFFWYSHIGNGTCTRTTVVILPPSKERVSLFRRIEFVADMLAEKLGSSPELQTMYELCGEQLLEPSDRTV